MSGEASSQEKQVDEQVLCDEEQHALSPQEALYLAILWHQNERIQEAEQLYRKLLEFNPEDPSVLNFFGMARYQQGYAEEGIASIKKALELAPDYIDAENNLGNIYLLTGHPELAEPCFRRVIAFNANFAPAYGNLGIVLKELELYQEAIDCLQKAIELEPDMPRNYQNLGNVYRHLGRHHEAVTLYRKSLELAPYDEGAYLRLTRTLFVMGELEGCAEVLKQWLDYAPDNPTALHMHAAYTLVDAPARASDAYVKETFDRFAASFDGVLKRLDYQAPDLVLQALQTLEPNPETWLILDAGCGTGLCGELIRPWAKVLVGADLSPKMLEQAKARKVYDQLFEAELTAFFSQAGFAYDAITCADTFCYFGDLTAVAKAALNAVKPGGWFIFTLEKHETDQSFQLHPHGRYSHSENYVRQTLANAGFKVEGIETAILRKERGDDVQGLVITAQARSGFPAA